MNTKVVNIYNPELKNRFLEDNQFTPHLLKKYRSIFSQLYDFEVKYDKDVCLIDDVVILQEIFNNMSGVTSNSIYTAKTCLKRYCVWCVNHDIDGAVNIVDNLKIENVDKFKSTMIKNPFYLQEFLDDVFDKEDENTIDNVYRCIYWLAYAGLGNDDIVLIKSDDVDFDTMSVVYNKESYPLYGEGVRAFKKCLYLTQFKVIHPRYEIQCDRVVGNQLLRGVRSDLYISTAKTAISRKLSSGHSFVKLTIDKARTSGFYYRLYEQEKYGVPIEFRTIAKKQMSQKEHNFNSKYTWNRVESTMASRLKDDYYKWKAAFNL